MPDLLSSLYYLKMMKTTSFVVLVFIQLFLGGYCKSSEGEPVSYGSVIKLVHRETGNNLHSHEIAWGSGSGQQSVTTNPTKKDRQSLWIVKEDSNSPAAELGTTVKCGDQIRLEHVITGKNLHSHLFRAALSGNQEVSGFGDGGNGDTGDNWKIKCEEQGALFWGRGKVISLIHADTNKYLSTSSSFVFNQRNCGQQCPIMDQTEVSCASRNDGKSKWFTDQGVYFPGKEGSSLSDNEL